jgi:ABC-type multidrug transport system ATPase subunit
LNKDELNNADTRKNEIMDILGKDNISVKRIERIAPSLEDVFVNLLEKDK